jgi:hypothetical protein
MAMGLAEHVWTVREYVRYPVHAGRLDRDLWTEREQNLLTNGLNRQKRRKTLPMF